MKTKAIFYFMLLLVLGAIFSCSSSDDEGIDYALVLDDYNYEPLFTHKDFEAVSRKYEETTNGTWAIRKVNGIVCQIIFFTEGTAQPLLLHLRRHRRISLVSSCL